MKQDGAPTGDWRARMRGATPTDRGEDASTAVPGTRDERRMLWCLLGLAAVLRLWDLPNIPYMHDEISALVRIFPSWSETLQRGVIEGDTHPPGVQFFEWCWTGLFGMSEAAVKLPFILLSIAALFFLYRFACAWTNATVALLATALFATLQYFVLYGQIARPYPFAFFTTALLADQLTRWLVHNGKRRLVIAALAALLSAYAHHFSMLQALIMGATGFVLADAARRRHLAIAAVMVLVLYAPNIPITLHQLAQGGLSEWLAPPGARWLPDYAWWIVHCSPLLAVAVIALLAWSLMQAMKHNGSKRFTWVALSWSLLPLAIGYAYSVWRAPVIQYSMLIFSFPYLLIWLLSGVRPQRTRTTAVLCAGMAAISVFTLITERKHFALFHRSKYETMLREAKAAQANYATGECLALFDAPPEVIRFYFDRWQWTMDSLPHVAVRGLKPGAIDSVLIAHRARRVFLGLSNGGDVALPVRIQSYYPFVLRRTDLAEGQCFLFSPDLEVSADLPEGQLIDRVPIGPFDSWKKDLPVVRATGTTEAFLDHSGRDYGIEFNLSRDTLTFDDHDRFELWATALADGPVDAHLVLELKEGDRSVVYRGASYTDCFTPSAAITTLAITASPNDAGAHATANTLKAYIWDRDKSALYVQGLCLYLREGNPVQYAFFEPIRGEWQFRR